MRTSFAAFLHRVWKTWSSSSPGLVAAAVSYYALFSVAPGFMIMVAIGSLVVQKQQLESVLLENIGSFFGVEAVGIIQKMIDRPLSTSAGVWYVIGGLLLLMIGASGIVLQLHTALRQMFGMSEASHHVWLWRVIRRRILSLLMLLVAELVMTLSLVASVFFHTVEPLLPLWIQTNHVMRWGYGLASWSFIVVIFWAVYSVLLEGAPRPRTILRGAVLASAFFIVGRYPIAQYIGHKDLFSIYGAAGAFVVMMVWMYYTVQTFLLGAAVIKVSEDGYNVVSHRRLDSQDHA